MIEIKGIDNEKCIKCLKCVKACPVDLFYKPETEIGEKRQIIFEDPVGSCIMCGHCVSICPTDAVIFESDEPFEVFEGVEDPSKITSLENYLHLIRSRRSIRQYKDKSVDKEDIEAILNVMKYAPTASNAQERRFVVVKDTDLISRIRKATENMMKLLKKLLKWGKYLKFLLPKRFKVMIEDPTREDSLERQLKAIKEGKDHVFHGAPVVIIMYAPVVGSELMAGNDAGLAFSHGMEAALTKGLGSCWIGFAQEALNRSDDLKEDLNIDDDMTVIGVMILGHPAVEYKKAPPREPLKVDWI